MKYSTYTKMPITGFTGYIPQYKFNYGITPCQQLKKNNNLYTKNKNKK